VQRETIERVLRERERDLLLSSCRYTVASVYGYQIGRHHDSILQHIETYPETLDLAPRGSGKSRIGTVGYITWRALRDPNIRILLVSDTDRHAQRFLSTIAAGLEYSSVIQRNFGDVRGPKWTSHEIVLKGRTKILTEATITAVGAYSGAATSGHYDVIIADDLVNYKNSRTEGLREMLIDWFKLTLYPTLVPGGELHVLGTRYHFLELYQVLIDEMGFHVNTQQAIRTAPATGEEASIWEAYMPLDDREDPRTGKVVKGLRRLREDLGGVTFALQYQNDVEPMKKGEIFHYDWFRWYTLGEDDQGRRTVVLDDGTVVPWKELVVFAGVDPAFATSERNDYCTIAVIAHHRETGNYFLLDMIHGRFTYNQRILKVAGAWNLWNPRVIGMEENGAQIEFSSRVRETYPYMRIRGLKTSTDKVSRAWSRSGLVENRKVHVRKGQGGFVSELCMMPDGEHDDQFDAWDFALEVAGVPRSGMLITQQKGTGHYLDRVSQGSRWSPTGDSDGASRRSRWHELH